MTDSSASNREVIRAAFEAWQDGTAPITDVFAPDMVWRIEGHSFASNEYGDRQAFIDEVLAPFGAPFERGETYENSYAWIMRLRDGKVVDGTAFYDSISFNDFWTRVTP